MIGMKRSPCSFFVVACSDIIASPPNPLHAFHHVKPGHLRLSVIKNPSQRIATSCLNQSIKLYVSCGFRPATAAIRVNGCSGRSVLHFQGAHQLPWCTHTFLHSCGHQCLHLRYNSTIMRSWMAKRFYEVPLCPAGFPATTTPGGCCRRGAAAAASGQTRLRCAAARSGWTLGTSWILQTMFGWSTTPRASPAGFTWTPVKLPTTNRCCMRFEPLLWLTECFKRHRLKHRSGSLGRNMFGWSTILRAWPAGFTWTPVKLHTTSRCSTRFEPFLLAKDRLTGIDVIRIRNFGPEHALCREFVEFVLVMFRNMSGWKHKHPCEAVHDSVK